MTVSGSEKQTLATHPALAALGHGGVAAHAAGPRLAFPLPLPQKRDTSTLVVARDGTPLRAFADADGVWRYPATPEQVSPLYLQALLNYEDRWFWRHPGVNPLALAARRRAMAAARPHRVRRFDADHAGRAHPRQPARPHTRTPWGKLQADPARAAARSASVQARDPDAVPRTRAVRRHHRGRRDGELGLSRQAGRAPVACGSGVARGAAAGAEPLAPGSRAGGRARRPRQGARPHGRARRVDAGRGRRREDRGGRVAQRCTRRCRRRCWRSACATEHPAAARIASTIDPGLQRTLEERVTDVFLQPAGAHLGGVAGGRQRDAGSARLCRLGRVRRQGAARRRRHGAGLAFAGFDAQAVPVRAWRSTTA